MRTAAIAAIDMAMIFSFALAGVKLHIDKGLERYFIEVDPQHERWALRDVARVADDLGFEMMPEWECPAEELPGGAIRHWLAEKEVVDARSSLQAV